MNEEKEKGKTDEVRIPKIWLVGRLRLGGKMGGTEKKRL